MDAPNYAPDPNFFTRFPLSRLRLLHLPRHVEEEDTAAQHLPRVPYTAAGEGGASPGTLPEDEDGKPAAGSFGVVFAAWDTLTQTKVAIKFSKKKLNKATNKWEDSYCKERAQILEEVCTHGAASALPCPSILKMLYAAEVEVDLDDYLFTPRQREDIAARGLRMPGKHARHAFVLEYASGHTLQDILANHEGIGTLANVSVPGEAGAGGGAGGGAGAVPTPATRPYFEKDKRDLAQQILAALAALHGAGITHRDLKPENIMLRHAPVVRAEDLHDLRAAQRDIKLDLAVFDFGLAIDAARGDVRAQPRAPPNFVGNIGSTYFLPPEVLSRMGTPKHPHDTCYRPPMDVFAAGVTLYLMLLGDSHCESDNGWEGGVQVRAPFARTWCAASRALLPSWEHFRANLLPYGQRYEEVYVEAWGERAWKLMLLPGLRLAPPSAAAAAAAAAAAPTSEAAIEAAICAEHYRRSLLLSEHARDLLARMLDPNPATRITAAEALQHRWFKEAPAELQSHVDPAQLLTVAAQQAHILRASKVGRLRRVQQWVGLVKLSRFVHRHLHGARDQRILLSAQDMEAVLARVHAREVERRAGAGAGAQQPSSSSILMVRGLSQQGLAAVLAESGVAAAVVARAAPVLWGALEVDCQDGGLVRECDFLTLLPLLSEPPQFTERALGLYFDIWDSNGDGHLSRAELVALMEAVGGLLPEATVAEREARHSQLVLRAMDICSHHPDNCISKSKFIRGVQTHALPLAELAVPLQQLQM